MRNQNIDLMKAFAIVSVILLHTWDGKVLLSILAPFHIWQAVPVFMILLGYNNALSYSRRGFKYLKDYYSWDFVSGRLKSVLIPFLMAYTAQVLLAFFIRKEPLTLLKVFDGLISGGRGPGSYFVQLTLQSYLILPIFHWLMLRFSAIKMLFIAAGVNIFFEMIAFTVPISQGMYRILIIRFIFALALGVYASSRAFHDRSLRKWRIPILISAIYIFSVMYLDAHFLMEHFWHSQHLPGFFWPFFLIVIVCRADWGVVFSRFPQILLVGKASFHIYLVQMIYFWAIKNQTWLPNLFWQAIFDLLFSVVFGLLFYRIQTKYFSFKKTSK